jgi:hypothetical protein
MRKIVSFVAAAAFLASSSVAFAAEGALPAADPHAAQTSTVVIPGFGTLTGAQAALFFTLVAAGTTAAVAFAAASSSSSTTI